MTSWNEGFKKAKAGVINWQPEYPDGEDQKSLENIKPHDQWTEKRKPDDSLVWKKMSLTFSLRRQQLNTNMAICAYLKFWVTGTWKQYVQISILD